MVYVAYVVVEVGRVVWRVVVLAVVVLLLCVVVRRVVDLVSFDFAVVVFTAVVFVVAVVVTADVWRTAVTSMNENVVGRGTSPELLPFARVVVILDRLPPEAVVAVVTFCTGLPLWSGAVVTAESVVTGMAVIPFSSVVGGAVVFASVTLN